MKGGKNIMGGFKEGMILESVALKLPEDVNGIDYVKSKRVQELLRTGAFFGAYKCESEKDTFAEIPKILQLDFTEVSHRITKIIEVSKDELLVNIEILDHCPRGAELRDILQSEPERVRLVPRKVVIGNIVYLVRWDYLEIGLVE